MATCAFPRGNDHHRRTRTIYRGRIWHQDREHLAHRSLSFNGLWRVLAVHFANALSHRHRADCAFHALGRRDYVVKRLPSHGVHHACSTSRPRTSGVVEGGYKAVRVGQIKGNWLDFTKSN